MIGKWYVTAPSLRNGVEPHTVKLDPFAGTVPDIGHVTCDGCRVSVTARRQHHRHGVNEMINSRLEAIFQQFLQVSIDGLKSWLSQIQPRDDSLIDRKVWKEMLLPGLTESMHRFLLKQAVEVFKQINSR